MVHSANEKNSINHNRRRSIHRTGIQCHKKDLIKKTGA